MTTIVTRSSHTLNSFFAFVSLPFFFVSITHAYVLLERQYAVQRNSRVRPRINTALPVRLLFPFFIGLSPLPAFFPQNWGGFSAPTLSFPFSIFFRFISFPNLLFSPLFLVSLVTVVSRKRYLSNYIRYFFISKSVRIY